MVLNFKGKKPVIGILANIKISQEEPFVGQECTYIHHHYVNAVIRSGGMPILLPVVQEEEMIRSQLELVEGLVIPGGYDVHPSHYGEEPHQKLEAVFPERDYFELTAIRIAYQLKKPMLGVCRGLQVLNVAFGGSLYQDLSLSDLTLIQHVQKSRLSALSHTIDLVPDTKLKAIFGKHEIQTNSSHHQAIKRLALGFKVNARSKDGLIEGMEKDEDLFVLGVQWHPEMMIDKHPQMINLFRALVKAVEQYKEQAGERRK